MKKSLVLISCFFIFDPKIYAIEKLKQHPRPKTEMTLASIYLLTTSLFSIYFFWPWYMDSEKISACNIYCDQCGHLLSAMEVYGYFACTGDFAGIKKLKQLLYKADVDKINQYLLKINMQEEQECVKCHDFCGWHLKK